MAKLLLLSILAATVVMPSFAARESNPARGLRKLLVQMCAVCVVYWLIVIFLTPHG